MTTQTKRVNSTSSSYEVSPQAKAAKDKLFYSCRLLWRTIRTRQWNEVFPALFMLIAGILSCTLVMSIELPYLVTVGQFNVWRGNYRPAQYNLSKQRWMRHSFFTSTAWSSSAISVSQAPTVTHAAGRQTGKRPVQRAGSRSSSNGDEGDGGGDGGGEPPHRASLSLTPEYVGGGA